MGYDQPSFDVDVVVRYLDQKYYQANIADKSSGEDFLGESHEAKTVEDALKALLGHTCAHLGNPPNLIGAGATQTLGSPIAKRGRGRPKSILPSTTSSAVKAKAKRAAPTARTTAPVSTPGAKRGPGRPKKQDTVAPTSTGRPLGRPRKSPAAPTSTGRPIGKPRQLTTITANLEHVELVTPVSRLNIVVESIGIDKDYNAFVNDKILRKRLVYMPRSHETVTKALEGLLDLTCLMVDCHSINPNKWRGRVERLVKDLSPHSPFPDMIDDEEEDVVAVSPVPPRGQKRYASAVESVDDDGNFSGFTRLPPGRRLPQDLVDYYREEAGGRGPLVPPLGNPKFAAAACATLPPTASDGAKSILYELITRPRYSFPEGSVSITHLTYETGLEYTDLRGYADELERLGRADRTSLYAWRPLGLTQQPTSPVAARVRQGTSTRPGPSRSQDIPSPSFATLPSAFSESRGQISRSQAPVGKLKLATTVCASLPSDFSVGAKKLLYELITRPQLAGQGGVDLSLIGIDAGIDLKLLLKYAEELRAIERVENDRIDATIWSPVNLFDAL
jgi:hypothetical protein